MNRSLFSVERENNRRHNEMLTQELYRNNGRYKQRAKSHPRNQWSSERVYIKSGRSQRKLTTPTGHINLLIGSEKQLQKVAGPRAYNPRELAYNSINRPRGERHIQHQRCQESRERERLASQCSAVAALQPTGRKRVALYKSVGSRWVLLLCVCVRTRERPHSSSVCCQRLDKSRS